MDNLTQLIIPIISALLIALLLFTFKGSSESSEFSSEKRQNYKKCVTEFRKYDEFLQVEKPLVGDLIECKRWFGVYDHWAVLVKVGSHSDAEDGFEVIHLIPNGPKGTQVRKDILKDVMKDSPCRVNDLKKSGLERGFDPR
jgi:hypothetical protein